MRYGAAVVKGLCAMLVIAWVSGTGCGGPTPQSAGGVAVSQTLTLQSGAFFDGGAIPVRYTAVGLNISPPLTWSNVPAGTQSFALTMTDDNAPGFTHWVIYNIPAGTSLLPEDLPTASQLLTPVTALQGLNSAGGTGYTGPDPPAGATHRYRLTLYALDTMLNITPGADIQTVLGAGATHALAQTQLTGTFGAAF